MYTNSYLLSLSENKRDSINITQGKKRITNTIFLSVVDNCKSGNNIAINTTTTIDKTPVTKENKEVLFFGIKANPNRQIAQKQTPSLRYPIMLQHT
ncbi:hypothetical protein CGC45_08130 [Francisella opportunistica]|uniref:Uncharacterized protein n=1 Tax=Francisella opportunistica TaxID=2016517 RepID=A0A345JTT9_9GAMM|nr:hypothetical protein CGC43_08095 [Francisella opportunistica]AXH32381.1 hypothetical protein CGC44_08070 [Francisella opportunistica]AXH34028.1 hypothetical protein CGC45_08130 [Francisella opportunistica]